MNLLEQQLFLKSWLPKTGQFLVEHRWKAHALKKGISKTRLQSIQKKNRISSVPRYFQRRVFSLWEDYFSLFCTLPKFFRGAQISVFRASLQHDPQQQHHGLQPFGFFLLEFPSATKQQHVRKKTFVLSTLRMVIPHSSPILANNVPAVRWRFHISSMYAKCLLSSHLKLKKNSF